MARLYRAVFACVGWFAVALQYGVTLSENPDSSAGELTLDLNYDPDETTHGTSAGGLVYLWENRTRQQFSLKFPDGTATTKWNFYAYVTGFEPGAPYDDKLTASATLMIDGAITWAGS